MSARKGTGPEREGLAATIRSGCADKDESEEELVATGAARRLTRGCGRKDARAALVGRETRGRYAGRAAGARPARDRARDRERRDRERRHPPVPNQQCDQTASQISVSSHFSRGVQPTFSNRRCWFAFRRTSLIGRTPRQKSNTPSTRGLTVQVAARSSRGPSLRATRGRSIRYRRSSTARSDFVTRGIARPARGVGRSTRSVGARRFWRKRHAASEFSATFAG